MLDFGYDQEFVIGSSQEKVITVVDPWIGL